jgi:regulatory protein
MNNPKLTPKQALEKIKHYCAWQERCHSEVEHKLYHYGLNSVEVAETVSKLIEENYLNEERFAIQYAGGKFRAKQWGRVKISYELKRKGVSSYCIKKALAQIDADEYYRVLALLATEKTASLKSEKNIFIKKRKLKDYLLGRGFEAGLVGEVVNAL